MIRRSPWIAACAAIAGIAAVSHLCGCDAPPAGPRGPLAPAPPTDTATSPEPDDAAGRELLARIVRAETTLDYEGTRIASYGPPGASRESRLRVVGTAAGRTYVEWTPPGDAAPRRQWSAGSRFAWVTRPELLLRNYTVTLDPAPSPPVAWRETRRVLVAGRIAGRPSMELLVDAEHWLVLAESCRTAGGEEWLRGRFEAVEFGARDTPDAPGTSEELPRDDASEPPPAGLARLDVAFLPEGFERVGTRTTGCGAWGQDFSDGLAGLSVQQRPAGTDEAPDGEVRRSRWLGGLALTGRVGTTAVTIHGGLPDADLVAVFRGLRAVVPAR